MKKLLALLSALTICLSFAACSLGYDDSSNESSSASELSLLSSLSSCEEISSAVAEESSASEEISSEISEESSLLTDDASEASADAAASFESVQDFIDANKDSFDTLKDSFANSDMELDISARGDSLVYTYKFGEAQDEIDALKEALDRGLENKKETFQSVLSSIQAAIPSAESVIVEYYSSSGDIITSREFK